MIYENWLVVFFCFVFFATAYALTAYRITYTSYKYDQRQLLEKIEPEIKTFIIINDSAAYKFYAKDTAVIDSNYLFNSNYVSHSETYVNSRDQWFYRHSKNKNSKWGFAKKVNIEWRVMNDSTKNVLGFNCTKAWGIYYGTDVYAWFTKDIPGDFDPMSGTHYPVVALEVYMLQYGRAFMATNIEKGNYKIVIPQNIPQEKNTP